MSPSKLIASPVENALNTPNLKTTSGDMHTVEQSLSNPHIMADGSSPVSPERFKAHIESLGKDPNSKLEANFKVVHPWNPRDVGA